MKHTPGPWTFGVYDATDNFRSIKQHSCVCDPETLALIATTGPADDPQSQKDAELVAAAPQLLEACQFALANLDYMQNLWGKEGITDHVADRLRAAISLAAIAAVEGDA